MEFWMNLMFGNSVGLMSMLVIFRHLPAHQRLCGLFHLQGDARRAAQKRGNNQARSDRLTRQGPGPASVAILRPTKARYTGSLIFMRGACRVS